MRDSPAQLKPLLGELKPRLAHFARRGALLAILPFALLVNSQSVHMNLQVEKDGSGLRQIIADASPYFKNQLPKWVNDVKAEQGWDSEWRTDDGTTFKYARDVRVPALDRPGGEAQLSIEDVFQNPLSLYTTYTWREEVSFAYLYPTDAAAAAGAGQKLTYRIAMPGTVTEATVQPAQDTQVQTQGSYAALSLGASQSIYTVTVTSQRLRWGYLIIVAYVLAFAIYKTLAFIGHRLRMRPRKI